MKKVLLISILCFAFGGIVQAQQQTDTLNIFFDIGKSAIDDNNAKLLDRLISEKNVLIYIYGYTDFLGNAEYNRQLSKKRSENVQDYLISRGINKSNIVFSKGEGVYPNSAEKNRQDFLDKGIQAHRMVQVVYSIKSQSVNSQEKLSAENLVVGNNIVLENIIFVGGTAKFYSVAYPVLKELFELMQKYSTLKIEIQGHVCCTYEGMEEPLSLSRAMAVYNYLVENGIDSTRMTYKGFGATRKKFPLEQNEREKQRNRRVEILILEK